MSALALTTFMLGTEIFAVSWGSIAAVLTIVACAGVIIGSSIGYLVGKK